MIIISILGLSCKKNGAGGGNSVRVPTLNTDVTNVTKNSAQFGSWISSDGGASINSKGFCYSTSPNPTTSNNTIAGVGTDNIYATVTGLNSSTTYYVKSYAINSAGTGYGEQETFTTLAPFTIGENYGGGIVFYIDATGLHGLIRTQAELGPTYIWGCKGINIPGTSTSLGTGQANTTAIINNCSTAGIAAKVCDDLVLNGFSDWFLPSKDELDKLCRTLNNNNRWYWSSSQIDINKATIQGFEFCGYFDQLKDLPERVWPVRKF